MKFVEVKAKQGRTHTSKEKAISKTVEDIEFNMPVYAYLS